MAKSNNNLATTGLSGKIGPFVFRQWYGRTVVGMRPKRSSIISAGQLAIRNLFKLASIYAKAALNNPVLLQFYESRSGEGISSFNLALADYFKPPEIGDIDTSSYDGSVGSHIKVVVTDNGKVESVRMRIEDNGSLLEEGDAILQADGMTFIYTATVANGSINGTSIMVDAVDLPGRHSLKQKSL